MSKTVEHFRTCTLCEAMCGIVVETKGTEVTAIRGDARDPFSRGHMCPKAPALKSLHDDPDRLRQPLIREGVTWRESTWDEALATAAQGIHAVQRQFGKNTLGIYLGNPNVHNLGSLLFMPQLVRALRTRHRYSATSVDQLPHQFMSYLMFGHQLLIPIPDIDRTNLWVIIGGNPLASNGSLMSAPDMKTRLFDIQKRGGEVVVIDPRRTETAAIATRHHFIKPETDAVLLLALLNVIVSENLVRLGHLESIVEGLSQLKTVAKLFTPAQAETICGIAAADITALARQIAATPKAVVYGRMGASTQRYGALCHWLINSLNILTGHLDVPGGAMFTTPALDGIGASGSFAIGKGSIGRWKSTVRGIAEFGGELPVATLAEDILDAGDKRLRGMVTVAGNPVLSTPNGVQLDRAFAQLDFMVSVDMYLNETTRHAHVILPPSSPLERSHYDLAFHLLAIRNTAKYSAPVFSKPKDAMHDWEIATALMQRLEILDGKNRLATRAKWTAVEAVGPEGLLAAGLQMGPHGIARKGMSGITLGKLRRQPHGIDLGPLQPCLPSRLQNKEKRIQLAPQQLLDDIDRLKRDLAKPDPMPFRLIGRRHVRNNNSWLHNAPNLMSGKPRWHLWLATEDAKRLGIQDGQDVLVQSRVGRVRVPVEITDDIMPGVVSLPHGFGHNRPGTKLKTAEKHAGVSINDLTDDRRIDELCGNAALNGVPVEILPSTP